MERYICRVGNFYFDFFIIISDYVKERISLSFVLFYFSCLSCWTMAVAISFNSFLTFSGIIYALFLQVFNAFVIFKSKLYFENLLLLFVYATAHKSNKSNIYFPNDSIASANILHLEMDKQFFFLRPIQPVLSVETIFGSTWLVWSVTKFW